MIQTGKVIKESFSATEQIKGQLEANERKKKAPPVLVGEQDLNALIPVQ